MGKLDYQATLLQCYGSNAIMAKLYELCGGTNLELDTL